MPTTVSARHKISRLGEGAEAPRSLAPALTLAAAVVLVLPLGGCRRQAQMPPVRLEVGSARPQAGFGARLVRGVGSAGGLIAAGTAAGQVLLLAAAAGSAAPGARRAVSLPLPAAEEGRAEECAITSLTFSAGQRRLLGTCGHLASVWDTRREVLVNHVRGPQRVTAGTIAADGETAYFGTEQGHVLRWLVSASSAEPLTAMTCAGAAVQPQRRGLPLEQRCPFGAYIEPAGGAPLCAYPVTKLLLVPHSSASQLARACREGTLSLFPLEGQNSPVHRLAGHVLLLENAGAGRLLVGREDGQLKLYEPQATASWAEGPVLRPPGRPGAAAASGDLIAVAQPGVLRIWHREHAHLPLAELPLDRPAVWVGLRAAPLELWVLLDDGRLLARPLRLKPR